MTTDSPRTTMSTMHDIADRAATIAFHSLGFVAGAIAGLLGGLYARRQAQAAVEVRPALTDVGIIDGALSGHLFDWLYYQYPTAMIIYSTVLLSLIAGTMWTFEMA